MYDDNIEKVKKYDYNNDEEYYVSPVLRDSVRSDHSRMKFTARSKLNDSRNLGLTLSTHRLATNKEDMN